MKIERFFFLFTAAALSISATQTIGFDALSLEQAQENGYLWSLKGEVIQMRGFWYPLSDEEGILASHPQLKSCCVGAPAKIEQQIVVKGDDLALLQPQRALTVEGIFNIEPAYNSKGELVQLFVLKQSREVPRMNSDMKWAIAILFIFFFTFWIWKKKNARFKNGN